MRISGYEKNINCSGNISFSKFIDMLYIETVYHKLTDSKDYLQQLKEESFCVLLSCVHNTSNRSC